MGKKATNSKPAAKPLAVDTPAAEPPPAARAKPAKAVAAPKRAAKPLPAKTPGFTNDDIALRAYFIAEKRRQHGLPGDEAHDWLEAERQLCAENGSPKKARGTKASAN